MKCAVAIVLALVGLAFSNPVPPLGLGIGYSAPVYFRSTVVNHGIPVTRVAVAPVIRPVVTAPVITSVAPVGLGWGGLGSWGGLGGWDGYGLGWGKGLH